MAQLESSLKMILALLGRTELTERFVLHRVLLLPSSYQMLSSWTAVIVSELPIPPTKPRNTEGAHAQC